MIGDTEEAVYAMEKLKNENLELKFNAIRKDIASLKTDLHLQLERTYGEVQKTNGSVAKALERIYTLERQDNKKRIEELQCRFEEYKKEIQQYKADTAFWHIISNNKWVAGLIIFTMYALSIYEIREMFITLLRLN